MGQLGPLSVSGLAVEVDHTRADWAQPGLSGPSWATHGLTGPSLALAVEVGHTWASWACLA